MTSNRNKPNRAKELAYVWFKTVESYHKMKIAKHRFKIAKAYNKYLERLERL